MASAKPLTASPAAARLKKRRVLHAKLIPDSEATGVIKVSDEKQWLNDAGENVKKGEGEENTVRSVFYSNGEKDSFVLSSAAKIDVRH